MPEPQILCRMCDNSVNKAVHGLAAILLVRLVGQPTKNVKNEICPHRCFAFYTRTARLRVFILNLLHVLWCSGSHTSHIYSRKWILMKWTMTPLHCKIYLLAAAYINHPSNYTHNITDTCAKQHLLKMAKI